VSLLLAFDDESALARRLAAALDWPLAIVDRLLGGIFTKIMQQMTEIMQETSGN
jgi:hypothetical protein